MSTSPEFDELFQKTRDGLERQLADQRQRADEPIEGTALDGQITIRLVGGRAESVKIDARAARLDNQTLGDHLRDAMNAALDQWRELSPAPVPVEDMVASLGDIQRQADAMMASVHSQMGQAIQTAHSIVAQHSARPTDFRPG